MKTARVAIASFFLLSCAAAWAAADGSDDIVAGFKAAAQAQAAASAAARRAEVQVAARAPFLWRVDGGAAPAYLFGTSHDIAAKNLDGAVFAKLAQSSAIVLEKSSDSNIMHERPELFWLPEGQSL
ncbi:MAG: hypothetical protein KGL74_12785, partial [Elusimicrobia bacterium]|nr:hypothetical protein [Elusimicrobiota bacterium]